MASSQMRLSGLISGMDTDSIIQQLVAGKQKKVDTLKGDQKKHEWKQEIWKDLNSQFKKLVNGTLDNLRYSSAYAKKVTEASNSSKVSITTDSGAMNSTQSLKINKLATSGYMTGAKLGSDVTSGSKLTDALGVEAGSSFDVKVGDKTTTIEITRDKTINGLIQDLQKAGVEANFDATNKRIFIGAKDSGVAGDFELSFSSASGQDALAKLGLLEYNDSTKSALQEVADWGNDAGKRTAAINDKTAKLTDSINSQITSLTEKNDKLREELTASADEFKTEYILDITDESVRAERKAFLEAKSEEELSDNEKAELAAINDYNDKLASIEQNEADLAALNIRLANVDTEAAQYVDNEAVKAQEKLDAWDSNASGAIRIKGEDAEIELNGATFTSSSNTMAVNGLNLVLKDVTKGDETITLTTKQDTSGVFDTIKSFFKEYNEIINKMDKLYNADSASKYTMLTDDEKDAMSDTEVEKWETTIKDSLLRRDSTISTAATAMKQIMAAGYEVNGKTLYLSSFGINTLSYFNAADNEKNAFHINGDSDDDNVKNETNDLMKMIEQDPDTVVSFFTQLSNSLYQKLNTMMAASTNSSYGSIYDDKKMKSEYDEYTSKIATAEEKLADFEDKWYSKFSKMETAMAKMQSNSNALAGILGGS